VKPIRFLAGIALVLAVAAAPFGAAAQQTASFSYDDRTLSSLYDAYLKKGGSDAYLEKRIKDERTRIRTLADKEVQALVDPGESGEITGDTSTLTKAVDRQRGIVELLNEELRDREVDVDLLEEEEKRFYLENATGTGSTETLRLTETHGELLAKKAVLEERIAALSAGLELQKDRLSKLSWQQWLGQFRSLFGFLNYFLIILGAVILDRLVRRRVARRIEEKGRRYLIAKLVTAGIYTVAALWVLSKLLSDHPSALASLAIVGAGIAVALQDVVKDIMGWILILQRRLFMLGNRVSIGQFTGDVIDIGPLRTTMLEVSSNGAFNAHERTGKTLYVPNSMVLKESVLNYNTTSDFMGVEMQVTITYSSDWRKAEAILTDTLKAETMEYTEQARAQQRRRTALFYTMWEVGEPEVHVDLESSGVLFTLKFTVPIGMRRAVVTKLTRSILQKFDAERDVSLAYNTIHIVGGQHGIKPQD
jgi:small-conductance mechanosensitive channel